jgi:hypothetical protein
MMHPRLLSHLILMAPTLGDIRCEAIWRTHYTFLRPETWPDIEDAKAYFAANIPWQKWDPRCFDNWIR